MHRRLGGVCALLRRVAAVGSFTAQRVFVIPQFCTCFNPAFAWLHWLCGVSVCARRKSVRAAVIPHRSVGFALPAFDAQTHLRHCFVYTSFEIHPVIVRLNMSREFDEDVHANHKKVVQQITYRHTSGISTRSCIRHVKKGY